MTRKTAAVLTTTEPATWNWTKKVRNFKKNKKKIILLEKNPYDNYVIYRIYRYQFPILDQSENEEDDYDILTPEAIVVLMIGSVDEVSSVLQVCKNVIFSFHS